MFTTLRRKVRFATIVLIATVLFCGSISPALADDGDEPVPFAETQSEDLEADSRLPERPVHPGDIPEPLQADPAMPIEEASDSLERQRGNRPQARPNEVIVQFRDRETFHNDKQHHAVGRVVHETPDLNARLLQVPDVAAALTALQHNPNVVLAAENAPMQLAFDPNDPWYASYQWHLKAWGTTRGSNLRGAWNLTWGNPNNRIVIVDTGIDWNHSDLKNKIVGGRNFVPGANSGAWSDCFGHGTQVAGTAAAATGNGIGVAGAAIYGGIYVAKVDSGCYGSMNLYTIANAISATSAWSGTKVINLSLGMYRSGTVDCTKFACASQSAVDYLKSAVQTARSRNVVVVAAAGNHAKSTAIYPAAIAGVLAVGATNKYGQRASFSNYGSPNVDVTAPGTGICTTARNNSYSCVDGTSFSSPLVAGIVMLARARYPYDSEGTIRGRIQRGSYNPACNAWNCYTNNYGYGVVNAYWAAY